MSGLMSSQVLFSQETPTAVTNISSCEVCPARSHYESGRRIRESYKRSGPEARDNLHLR